MRQKGVRLDHFFNNLPESDLENLTWQIDDLRFQIPKIENNPIQFFGDKSGASPEAIRANTILYFVLFNTLLHAIEKNKAETILLKIPTFTEVLKLTNSKPFPSPQFNGSSFLELNLLRPFSRFMMESAIPIFYPHDNHWTPAGHRLAAWFLYNAFVKNILNVNQHSTKTMDIIGAEIKRELNNANERIAQILKSDPFGKFVQGIRYKNINKLDKAKRTLIDYLTIRPGDFEAHYQLGMVYWSENNFNQALVHFKASLEGHILERPKYQYTYQHTKLFGEAWRLYKNNQDDDALIILKKAEKLGGYFLDAVYSLFGSIYSRKGNISEAERYFKEAIEIKPEFSQYYRSLGNLYFDNQQYRKAIHNYKKSLEKNPRELKVYLLISIAYKKDSNKTESLRWFQEFLDRGGNYDLLREWKMISTEADS